MYKVTEKVKKGYVDSKVAVDNLTRLISSVALLVVAITCYLMVYHKIDPATLSTFARWVITFSCVEIGLLGAWAFCKFLANK